MYIFDVCLPVLGSLLSQKTAFKMIPISFFLYRKYIYILEFYFASQCASWALGLGPVLKSTCTGGVILVIIHINLVL